MDYEQQQETLATLRKSRKFVQQAHDAAEARHDSYGDDYMSDELYGVMQETKALLADIDALLKFEDSPKPDSPPVEGH